MFNHIPESANIGLLIKGPGDAQEYIQRIQTGTNDIPITLDREGRIEGKVIFSDTGKPVRNIIVAAFGGAMMGESGITEADENGKFLFTNLPEGMYMVSVLSEEKFPEWISAPVENVEVVAGKITSGIEVKMIKGGIISGKVTNSETGEPISGIHVGRRNGHDL